LSWQNQRGILQTLRKMAVRLRIILTVFLLTGAVVVALTLITFWFGNRVLQAHAREQMRRESIAQLEHLESIVKDAETGERGFIITGDEKYLEPFNDASRRLPAELVQLRAFPWIDASPEEVSRLARLIEQKMEELRSTIESRRRGELDAALAKIQTGTGKQLMDDLRAEMSRLKERERSGLKVDADLSDRTTRTRTIVFILSGIIDIGVLAWAYRRISEALKQRDEALQESSRRGYDLQQQKDLLSVTLNSIGDCVIVTDKSARITFMNPIAERVTGWKLREAIGHRTSEVFRIINEQTRQPVENPVEKVMKRGVIVGLGNHTILIRKDGSQIPIDDSGAPIRDQKGEIRGVVLVFRDFSERRAAERELRLAKESAETANKAKDQFLAMLSHELRTPLTPVLATLNLWEASEEVPQSLQADVQMLRRSIELEARIIDDLLDLTRVARGMLSFSPEHTDVHALIEFLIGLSQSEFQNKALKISLHLDANRHFVYTDAARLQQVLWNILRNAIKFTDQGGNVTIKTSNDTSNNIDIAITDDGIGMTPETISKLFVPFEQADPTSHRRYGGLGLGMAISSALIELLEGKLRAESPGLGCGSTFTVTFPTADVAAKPTEPSELSASAREKLKLLLVEDHVETAQALCRLLEHRGYKIETAPTVATGLEAIERDQFDLIVCDLGLPDGTGFDLIEKIRKNRNTPAIALTGFGMEEDVERAMRAGFNAHLTKPVNLQKLEATIWQLLRDRR
jgi:PAS domain S-box-containing protein